MGFLVGFVHFFLRKNFKTKVLTAQQNLLLECLVSVFGSPVTPHAPVDIHGVDAPLGLLAADKHLEIRLDFMG